MLFLVCKLLTCSLCSQISTLETEWRLKLSKLSHFFLLDGFLNSVNIGSVLQSCVRASWQAPNSVICSISGVSLGRDKCFLVCPYKTIIIFGILFSAAEITHEVFYLSGITTTWLVHLVDVISLQSYKTGNTLFISDVVTHYYMFLL